MFAGNGLYIGTQVREMLTSVGLQIEAGNYDRSAAFSDENARFTGLSTAIRTSQLDRSLIASSTRPSAASRRILRARDSRYPLHWTSCETARRRAL
jgi:hypothetical protein